jgi:hypothetical protein
MTRFVSLLVCLVVLVSLATSCRSTEKSDQAERTYRLDAGDKLPPELARTIESKVLREGKNEIDDFPTGKLFAVVKNGELDSLVLEERGEKPRVLAMRVTSPAPGPTDETPQSCDQKYNNCISNCGSASDPECCLYKCYFEYWSCTLGSSGGGGGSGGITMF